MKTCIAAAACLVCATAASAQQSPSATDPQVAFNNNCRQCHSVDENDNRLGPNLYEIVGRTVASAQNFRYSSSLSSSDFTWDEATLDEWIENPDAVAPGNNMKPYAGITDADVRAAIIQHLGGSVDGEDPTDGEEPAGG